MSTEKGSLLEAAALHQSGRTAEAEAIYRRVLERDPQQADALHLLGVLQVQAGAASAGIELIRRAIAIRPDVAAFHENLGRACQQSGDLAGAEAAYVRAVQLMPSAAGSVLQLSRLLEAQGRISEAHGVLERGLVWSPRNWEILSGLGVLADLLGQKAAALEYLQLALHCGGPPASVLTKRGVVYQRAGVLGAAIDCYREALRHSPQDVRAAWNLAVAERAVCAPTQQDMAAMIRERPAEFAGVATTFELLTMTDDAALLHQSARLWTERHAPADPHPLCRPETVRRQSTGRIRIGYLSDELREHPMGRLMGGLFQRHDRRRFEVGVYYFGPQENSELHRRLRSAADSWKDVAALSSRAIAEQIYADRIDILIDVKGHVVNSRPAIAASRPAPLQVNWLGCPGTMGADYMDYILVDEVVVPAAQADCFSEQVVWLPNCYQVNDPERPVAPATPPRTAQGLPEQGFVFCCFNQIHKITPDVFVMWLRLLRRVPGSVLWLLAGPAEAQQNLLAAAVDAGVSPQRLVFAPRLTHADHLARLSHADLFLDTQPYGAHATTSDALWAGLPIVTCLGRSFAGRVAASLLTAIGLPELIAADLAACEQLAARLATTPQLLSELQQRLRRNLRTAPLFDCDRFVRNLDTALEAMWQRHCRGQRPVAFRVTEFG